MTAAELVADLRRRAEIAANYKRMAQQLAVVERQANRSGQPVLAAKAGMGMMLARRAAEAELRVIE